MTGNKRRDRPPLDAHAPSVNGHVRLTTTQYDATLADAKRARLDFGEFIRRALQTANATPPTRS